MNDKMTRGGLDFSKWKSNDELGIISEKGNQYQHSTDSLRKVLKKLPISCGDAIIDIGCGKGKALWLMSNYEFRRIDGFDLSQEMVDIANANFNKINDDRLNAFWADAESFDDYEEYNYFYLANSVPDKVYEKMIEMIQSSIKRKPRDYYFICMNSYYEDVLYKKTDFRLLFSRIV